MALMNCPDCGVDHSDLAFACPKCGMPNLKVFNENHKAGAANAPKIKKFLNRNFGNWKKSARSGVIILACIALAPRVIKIGLHTWDPFEESQTITQVIWKWDGGYSYSRSVNTVASWGVTWMDNSSLVKKSCSGLDGRNNITYPQESDKIVAAVPQIKNVDGGSCNGTLYTFERSEKTSGWEKLLAAHCRWVGSLVRTEPFIYMPYLITGPSVVWLPRDTCYQR